MYCSSAWSSCCWWRAEDADLVFVPYDDPFASLELEIAGRRARVAELERAERDRRRAERDARLDARRQCYKRTSDLESLDPNSGDYLEVLLAHTPADQRDAVAAAWEDMQAFEDTQRRADQWSRLRVTLGNEPVDAETRRQYPRRRKSTRDSEPGN